MTINKQLSIENSNYASEVLDQLKKINSLQTEIEKHSKSKKTIEKQQNQIVKLNEQVIILTDKLEQQKEKNKSYLKE